MGGFRRYFWAGNWPSVTGQEGDMIFASRTSTKRTWERWTWKSRGTKTSPTNGHTGDTDLNQWLKRGEKKRKYSAGEMSARPKENNRAISGENVFTYIRCKQDCHCRVGLYNLNRCYAAISIRDLILCVHIQCFSRTALACAQPYIHTI